MSYHTKYSSSNGHLDILVTDLCKPMEETKDKWVKGSQLAKMKKYITYISLT